jgi:hypothetical protein
MDDIHHCHEIFHMGELNFMIENILLTKFTTWMMKSTTWINLMKIMKFYNVDENDSLLYVDRGILV